MSTPARLALDHTAVPWLFAAAAVTIAPHFLHQPLWLSAFAGLMLFWGGWLWWQNQRLPGRWLLVKQSKIKLKCKRVNRRCM